jgi:hypothetical protein
VNVSIISAGGVGEREVGGTILAAGVGGAAALRARTRGTAAKRTRTHEKHAKRTVWLVCGGRSLAHAQMLINIRYLMQAYRLPAHATCRPSDVLLSSV